MLLSESVIFRSFPSLKQVIDKEILETISNAKLKINKVIDQEIDVAGYIPYTQNDYYTETAAKIIMGEMIPNKDYIHNTLKAKQNEKGQISVSEASNCIHKT
eukprot:UN19483